MAGSRYVVPYAYAYQPSGAPIPGALLNFYVTGSNTVRADTYSDASLTTPNSNPVAANSSGTFPSIFLDSDVTYRVVLTYPVILGEAEVWAADPVFGDGSTSAATVVALKALPVSAGAVAFLTEDGREGAFIGRAGAPPVSDPNNGIYITSNTSGFYWERIWDQVNPLPDWWGGKLNDSGVDSYDAIIACLTVTGRMTIPKGTYYSSHGIALPVGGAVVQGAGSLQSSISVSSATDHLMSIDGVPTVSYAGYVDLSDFALGRSVNPTTPASVANDITQGHGLHFAMASNPRVRSVYTYNNLVECYVSNCLSPDIADVRGLRQTGGGGDRWYGLYVDGVTGGGTFGGPSPNPSSTVKKPNMIANPAVGTSYNYYLAGALQDLWIVDPEAAAGTTQFLIDSNDSTAGDFHIVRPICDGYGTFGIHIKDTNFLGSLNIIDAWIAPKSGAASSGVRIESSSGVKFSGRGDFSLTSGLLGVQITDSSLLNIEWHSVNCQSPVSATSMIASELRVFAAKNFIGAAFGSIVTCVGGSRNKVNICAVAYDTQQWVSGFNADATASGYSIDVSGIAGSTTTDRVVINAAPVATQGNVGGHNIFNPSAGPLL